MLEDLDTGSLESDRWLRRWMLGGGIVYLLLAVNSRR